MKKFFKKYYGVIIVVVLIAGFIALSLLIDDKGGSDTDTEVSEDLTAWIAATKTEEPVVAVMAMTTCPHCENFKPVVTSVYEEYGFKLYWFYIDEMSDADYTTLATTYELANYENAVPYTFIIKNGKFIADHSGEMDSSSLTEFLKTNSVIK